MFGKNNGKEPSAPQPVAAPADGTLQMVIQFRPDTQGCQVMGPLKNPGMCYAMLEMARDVVHNVAMGLQQQKGLTPPPPGFDPKAGGHA